MRLVSLICHRDVELGIKCLGSLLRYCRGAEGLCLLDDGSLTPEDSAKLQEQLPGCSLILRSDRDAAVEQRLANYPNCRAYRREHPMGLKLLDALTLFREPFFFADADILFFRPFTLESVSRAAESGFVFMEDEREGYSGRSLDLVYRHGLRIFSRVNAGMIAFAPHLFDLDFVEWFLKIPEFRVHPHLLEQTCWAAVSREHSTWFPRKQQIRCATADTCLDEQTVALHFIYPFKGQVDRFSELDTGGGDPVAIELVPAPRLTASRIVMNGVHNSITRFKMRWQRWRNLAI